jgi:hypothetical protein
MDGTRGPSGAQDASGERQTRAAEPATGRPSARARWEPPTVRPYGSLRNLVRAATGPMGDGGAGGMQA